MRFNMIQEAALMAYNLHAGQKDKAGASFIYHPQRVAAKMNTSEERIVAWLHDIPESFDGLPEVHNAIRSLFGDIVADAVFALTRQQDESYTDYIKRVKRNPLATKVKIADLVDNSNLSRLDTVTVDDVLRQKKYNKALLYLMDE